MLLGLQDQLSRLEESLNVLDNSTQEKVAPDVHNGSFRRETREDREDMICQAQRLLREYSESWSFYTAFNERSLLGLRFSRMAHGEITKPPLVHSFSPLPCEHELTIFI